MAWMKKTLNIDAELLAEARKVSGAATDTETIRQGLQALVRRAAYERLPWAVVAPHAEVVALARQHRLTGRGLGWVDMHLLAAARRGGFRVWTAEEPLAAAAAEMGVGWRP
ncbi:MAG TPA: type II toxin-antitoxin system VapB family antitoxin [Terriglobales bacterium]|nr:type II toxin-antitoxin system VapB family antitoxin [Terriglobales bacterium]